MYVLNQIYRNCCQCIPNIIFFVSAEVRSRFIMLARISVLLSSIICSILRLKSGVIAYLHCIRNLVPVDPSKIESKAVFPKLITPMDLFIKRKPNHETPSEITLHNCAKQAQLPSGKIYHARAFSNYSECWERSDAFSSSWRH